MYPLHTGWSNSDGRACSGAGYGWTLVRHVPAGLKWHQATDQLRGTEEYGNPTNDQTAPEPFSIKFDETEFDQFLFSTGNCEKWLIADKNEVVGKNGNSFYQNEDKRIWRSSETEKNGKNTYMAKWIRMDGYNHHPWISGIDHKDAKKKCCILYGGNSFGGLLASCLKSQKGANVFIRKRHGMN